MRAAFFRITCALWVFGASAFAQHILKWERFNVYVDLDNDGRVRVQETLEVFLNGKIPVLDRPLARCSVLQVIEPKLSRLGDDDAFHPVPGAELREQERMMFWRISADDAPEWQDQRMTFRLEYEVRGLVAPAWDIPIGPGSFLSHENFPHFTERIRETLAAWRQPLGRYRFDHDVLFARFSNEGPSELNYTFHYDTAWKHPWPDAPLGARVTPEVNYRVTELRDYLRPGPPPAVPIWKAAVRIGSIIAVLLVPLALWLAFAADRIRRHGLHGPQLDREWFREYLLPLIPEGIPAPPGVPRMPSRFARFLSRLRRRGVIEIHEAPAPDDDSDAVLHLRLLTAPATLPRFERALVEQLFPDGPEIDSVRLGEIYAESGFSPEAALGAALDEADEADEDQPPEPKPMFWPIVSWLLKLIALPAAALVLFDAFTSDYNDGLSSSISLSFGFALLAGLTFVVRPLGGLGKALIALVPIVAAILAFLAFHFHHTLPLSPAASAGLALMVIWLSGSWLSLLIGWNHPDTPNDRVLQLGRRLVSRELRKRHPALEAAWLPHIVALVGETEVLRWQVRFGNADEQGTTMAMHQDAAPFTGNFSVEQEEAWTTELYVVSRAELAELEADEPRND